MPVMLSKRPDGFYDDLTILSDLNRYTVYANFDDVDTEEINVLAATRGHAREIARAALRRDYLPGGEIIHIESLDEEVLH